MGGALILSNAQKSVPAHSPHGVFGALDLVNEDQVPQLVLSSLAGKPVTSSQRQTLTTKAGDDLIGKSRNTRLSPSQNQGMDVVCAFVAVSYTHLTLPTNREV